MEDFLQYFFDGLSQGSIYAFLALGLVIIYRGSGHLNFAQGEMAMMSGGLGEGEEGCVVCDKGPGGGDGGDGKVGG